jgi:FkbM family methyltransferase
MKHQTFHRAVVGLASRLPVGRMRVFRFANQFAALSHGLVTCSTSWGGVLQCDPQDFIDQRILAFGVWEPQLTRVISDRLEEGDLFVDIGANIGYYSVLAGLKVGATGKVVAIEASPSIFRRLTDNVAENPIEAEMRLVHLAVSDQPATLDFYRPTDTNSGRSSIFAGADMALEARVQALPLHQILSADELQRVRLVKIDIEGSEPPVVRSMLDNLHLYSGRMELVVEASACAEWASLFDRFLAAGFAAYAIPNNYGIDDYMRHRDEHAAPERIHSLPPKQTDILFTRGTPN